MVETGEFEGSRSSPVRSTQSLPLDGSGKGGVGDFSLNDRFRVLEGAGEASPRVTKVSVFTTSRFRKQSCGICTYHEFPNV